VDLGLLEGVTIPALFEILTNARITPTIFASVKSAAFPNNDRSIR